MATASEPMVTSTPPAETIPSTGRLAHFLPVYPQPGGAAVAVAGLLDAAGQRGRCDVVLAYGAHHRSGDAGGLAALSRARLVSPLSFPRDPVTARLQAATDVRALVLHGVLTPSCARISAWARHRRPDLAVVAYPHDGYDDGLFGSKRMAKRAYWHAIERPHLQRADFIVVSAPSHAELLADGGVSTPTIVSPPGLTAREQDRAASTLTTRASRELGGRVELLVLGRWDIYEKGLDLICQALAGPAGGELRRRTRVRFVGPELGQRPAMEGLVSRWHLDEVVELVGFVDDPWHELERTDGLVLASRKEGFGLVGLQALAAGVPVVLSTAAGLSEHCQGAAIVPTTPDAGALRDALSIMVDERDARGRCAAASAAETARRFTWRKVIDDIAAALG